MSRENFFLNRFIQLAIKRRFIVLVVGILLFISGIVALKTMKIEAYPELAAPQVRVITLYPGKGAEEVERLITVPLEKELNGIPHQTALRSISLYGLSVITMQFEDGTLLHMARAKTLERISQAELPADAHPGLDAEVGSLREIYRYTLQSPYYTPMSLRAIQEWQLEKALRQIPGVIGVVSQGGPSKSYQVNVDPDRLKANQISLTQVYEALANSNATTGGNFIQTNGQAYIIRGLGLLRNVADIASVPIVTNSLGVPIRIGDVASVEIGPKVRRGQVGMNNLDDVVEGIVLLRRGENPSEVLTRLYEKLPEIQASLPKGVFMVPFYDRSQLINKTLHTVGENVIFGISLVVILLGFFFLDLRAAAITACVIPLSVLFAFICLNLLGVPANLLSLGAIDFGILVDGAVIMTENIIRKLSEEGQQFAPQERMLLLAKAAQEVGGPILFGISTIIATFLPIFTFGSIEGKLFHPLALTMVSALIGAGLFALTVVPVLCSFVLTKKPLIERHNPVMHAIRENYSKLLAWSLKNPFPVLSSTVCVLVVSVFVFFHLGSEFLPHLEEGNIWLRTTIKPGSVDLDESIAAARKVRAILQTYPEVNQVLSQSGGPDDGTDPARFADQEYMVDLKSIHDWRPQFHENKDELIASMKRDLSVLPNVDYYFTQYIQTTVDESLSGVQGSLVAKIAGPDLAELERLGHQVGGLMKQTPGVVDVIVDPLLGQTQLAIEINRDEASRYGLNVSDLMNMVETAIGGKSATELVEGERHFDVMLRLESNYRENPLALSEILVDTPGGMKVPLSQFATIKTVNGATQIWREAGTRLATIRANVRGRDLAAAVEDAQKRVEDEVKLPEGYRVVWSGEFQRQREALHQLSTVLPITMVVILLILFLSFRSLRASIIVFSVVPMAAIGGILLLYFRHIYFSISAGVGFIALFGFALQNGILLITVIRQMQSEGTPVAEAVYYGAMQCMRPVMMTALVATVGLMPAALSNEIGSQTQRPFATVIIGGLISATILTLLILPTLYNLFSPSVRNHPERLP